MALLCYICNGIVVQNETSSSVRKFVEESYLDVSAGRDINCGSNPSANENRTCSVGEVCGSITANLRTTVLLEGLHYC